MKSLTVWLMAVLLSCLLGAGIAGWLWLKAGIATTQARQFN